jgi:hypothetical protein
MAKEGSPVTLRYLWGFQVTTQVLSAFDVFFTFVLLRYLWCQKDDTTWREYVAKPNVQAAGAVLVHMIGLMVLRFWAILLTIVIKYNGNIFDWENAYPLSLVGGLICVVGVCWMIRAFSPVKWGEWSWIMACLIASVFTFAMQTIT